MQRDGHVVKRGKPLQVDAPVFIDYDRRCEGLRYRPRELTDREAIPWGIPNATTHRLLTTMK